MIIFVKNIDIRLSIPAVYTKLKQNMVHNDTKEIK